MANHACPASNVWPRRRQTNNLPASSTDYGLPPVSSAHENHQPTTCQLRPTNSDNFPITQPMITNNWRRASADKYIRFLPLHTKVKPLRRLVRNDQYPGLRTLDPFRVPGETINAPGYEHKPPPGSKNEPYNHEPTTNNRMGRSPNHRQLSRSTAHENQQPEGRQPRLTNN